MTSDELHIRHTTHAGEPVIKFSMRSITVDGMYTHVHSGENIYIGPIFSLKSDGLSVYDGEFNYFAQPDKDGYLDDSKDEVAWDSAYNTYSYAYGDIDEDIWLRKGFVIGKYDSEHSLYL